MANEDPLKALIALNGQTQPIDDSQAQIENVFQGTAFEAPHHEFNDASNYFLKTRGFNYGQSLSRSSNFVMDWETLRHCNEVLEGRYSLRALWSPTYYLSIPKDMRVKYGVEGYLPSKERINFTPYGNYVPVLIIQQSSRLKSASGGNINKWAKLTNLSFHLHVNSSQLDFIGGGNNLTNNYHPLLTSSGSDTRTTFKVENLRCIYYDENAKERLKNQNRLTDADLVCLDDIWGLFRPWFGINVPSHMYTAMQMGHLWLGWIAGPDNLSQSTDHLYFTISELDFDLYKGYYSGEQPEEIVFTHTSQETRRYIRNGSGTWTATSGTQDSLPLYIAQFGTSSSGKYKFNNSSDIFRSPVYNPNGKPRFTVSQGLEEKLKTQQHMNIKFEQTRVGWNNYPDWFDVSGALNQYFTNSDTVCIGPGPLFMSLSVDPTGCYDATMIKSGSEYTSFFESASTTKEKILKFDPYSKGGV